MSYVRMKKQLLAEFEANNFSQEWRKDNVNTLKYQVPNDYNLDLTICYPGKKTVVVNKQVKKYDYRVDLNGITISHVNIVVDLYNKACQLQDEAYILEELLIDLARNGTSYRRNNYIHLDKISFAPPNKRLLDLVTNIHTSLNKTYNLHGNLNWNYSLDELASLISWIALQEDINYPMPRFEGRRMPFYRYIEALYCANNPADRQHTLKDAIIRTLSHNRPPLWNECNINYEPIIRLGKRV